jgi:hypothetical protein
MNIDYILRGTLVCLQYHSSTIGRGNVWHVRQVTGVLGLLNACPKPEDVDTQPNLSSLDIFDCGTGSHQVDHF